MKRSILVITVLVLAWSHSYAQDSTKPSLNPQLLSQYLNIKNALVAGNSSLAASGAEAFLKAANGIDYKIISEGNINTLLKDAGKISETNDLNKQRLYFANFSANMVAVAKALKFSDSPLFVSYCPMKHAYWLSLEKSIKNPYYGSSMLTCGEVKETIQ